MGHFGSNPITAVALDNIGPQITVVGTDGNYQNLTAAIAAGKRWIRLATGCTTSGNINLSSGNYWIWSPHHAADLTITHQIQVSTTGYVHLEGFTIDGASGTGLYTSGSSQLHTFHRLNIVNCATHGIYLLHTGNAVRITNCRIDSNTNDGIKVGANADNAIIKGNTIWGNGGWGINDLTDTIIEGNNRIANNSGGQRNTASASIDGASRLT
jgi:hypothetical protein